MLARPLRASAGESHGAATGGAPRAAPIAGSVPPIGKPPLKPVRTHRLRNFTLLCGLVGAAVYGGGAWLAKDNDTFYDYFTEYVPGAHAVMDFIETRGSYDPKFPSERVHQLTERAVARARSDAAKITEAAKQKAGEISHKAGEITHKVQEQAAAVIPAAPAPAASASAPASALSNITGRNFNSDLSALVKTINEYTQGVNSGRATDAHIASLEQALQGLNAKISSNRAAIDEEISERLYKQGLALDEELAAVKSRLVSVYNERLEAEVQAARSAVLAEANNRIQSQYVELQEAAARRAAEYVDSERDGRLRNIEQLESKIKELEKTVAKSGKAVGEYDSVVSYVTEVERLRSVLGGEAQGLSPQLTAIRRALPEDPLVKAAIEAIPQEVQEHGVLSVSQLAARFARIVPEIRKASLVPPNAGIGGHIASSILSSAMIRKQGLPEGEDIESVLARTETYLSQGKVIDAVAEVNSLKGWPKEIAGDWLYEGRKRSEVEFLARVLSEEGYAHSVSRSG